MKKSKYVGKEFPGHWICTKNFLFANYSGGTKHNAYKYILSRITSDKACDKIIIVSGRTMLQIANGTVCADNVAEHKKSRYKTETSLNNTLYKFA